MVVRKINGRWYCRKRYEKGFPSKKEALRRDKHLDRFIARLESDIPDAAPCCTIRDKLNEFIRDCMEGDNRKPCNEKTADLHRRRLLKFDRAFHSKPLDCISRRDVEAWRNRRRTPQKNGRQIQRDTVNAEIGTLKLFARWAQAKEYAPPGLPLETVGRLQEPGKLPGKNRKPPEILELDQAVHIIRKIGEVRQDIELFFMGMLLFLLRPAAVANLRRRNAVLPVLGRSGRLHVKGLKGAPDRSLTVKRNSRHERWLMNCLRMGKDTGFSRPDDPLVICITGRSRLNPGGWTTATLDQAVRSVCARLDFGFKFNPYMIRHSTVSFIQDQEGMSLANVQTAAGHLRVTTQESYTHRKASQAQPAFDVLDGFFRQLEQPPAGSRGADPAS